LLDPARPEGAPFDRSVGGDLGKPAKKGGGSGGDVILRSTRSVYLPVFRSRLPGMFTVFDFAEPDQVNGQRNVTTVPTQALFFLNNPFVLKAANECAGQLLALKADGDADRIKHAYTKILGRSPAPSETERALAFVREGEDAWPTLGPSPLFLSRVSLHPVKLPS